MNLQAVRTHLQTLIVHPTEGCVLVCKDEKGNILGGFAGGIQKEWFSATLIMAFDYCLFVRAINRGGRAA